MDIRAIAGAMYVLIGYLPYTLYSGKWHFYLVWMAVSAGTGYCVSRFRLKDNLGDFVIGIIVASALFAIGF